MFLAETRREKREMRREKRFFILQQKDKTDIQNRKSNPSLFSLLKHCVLREKLYCFYIWGGVTFGSFSSDFRIASSGYS